jgi:hypothetical protein
MVLVAIINAHVNINLVTTMIDIDKLNEAALIDLNHRVVARLKFLQQMRAHGHMLDFSIGQRVAFQPEGQPQLTGIIAKYNRKTVTVITDNGQQWRVSPQLLQSVQAQPNQKMQSTLLP